MKILYVVKKYPPAIGGDATVVYNLEQHQKKRHHQVRVLTSNCKGLIKSKGLYRFGFKTTAEDLDRITIKRLLSLIHLFLVSFKVLREERPDIIHSMSPDMTYAILFAAKFYKIPVIHTCQILTFNDDRHTLLRRKSELFFLRSKAIRRITVLTPSDVEDFKKVGFSNVVFVPNGINLEDWRVKGRKKKSKTFTFIAVGRLEEQKGFQYLIEAAATLLENGEKFVIKIVGEGSLYQELQRQIERLGLSEHVFLLGKRSQKELKQLYAKADAYVLSSLYEGMPLTLLEAWAADLPAICTNVNSIPYIAKDAALIVPHSNSSELAKALESLIKDKNLCKKLQENSRKTITGYTWNNVNQEILSEYEYALKPQILQISAYCTPHLGGQGNVVYDLSLALAQNNYDVDIVTSSQGWKATFQDSPTIKVHRFKSVEFGHSPIMWGAVWYLLKNVKSRTLVHLHIGQAFLPELVLLISKIRKFSYIAELHIDAEPSSKIGILLPAYKRLFLKRVINNAVAVLVLNKEHEKMVRSAYGYTGKIFVVTNGVSDDYFSLERSPETGEGYKLLFAGRLSRQKNLPVLLQAMAGLPDLKLDIVGDGELREDIERRIRNDNLTNVSLHGALPRRAVSKFYKNCNALILPSLYEAQPLVLLEAMAARIPIIGSNVNGIAEHINGIGLLAEPEPESLIKAIKKLQGLPAKKINAMTEKGYKEASLLRWSNLVKDYERIYEKVTP